MSSRVDGLLQLSLDQAKAVARSLAGVQATWGRHDELHKAEWLPLISPWSPDADWFESRRTLFLERFGDRIDGLASMLLAKIERAPAVVNERMASSLITLVHGDLHLDNFVFEQDMQPVILDWARCAKGPAELDLAALLFGMSNLEDLEPVLTTYLNSFEKHSAQAIDPIAIRSQLGGALLRRFTTFTLGNARWQPASRRGPAIIDTSIERAIRSVEHWFTQDPELFSFLG